jgi:ribonuclease HI
MDKMLEILKDVKVKGFSENEQDVVDYNSKYVGCVDGAFNVKKSIAGYGWIIYNNKGEIIEKDSGKVDNPKGSMFKNVAGELIGTIRLVEHAIKLNLGENLVVFDYYGIQKYFDGEWMTREGFTKNNVMRMKELNKSILIKMKKVY